MRLWKGEVLTGDEEDDEEEGKEERGEGEGDEVGDKESGKVVKRVEWTVVVV